MRATELLEIIRDELKDYPIEYLRNKATDERYTDPLVKKLAKYNSEVYDEIYSSEPKKDFEIKDGVITKFKADIDYYFETYAGGDIETREFTKYLSLYLALIAKRPLLSATIKRMKFTDWMIPTTAREESNTLMTRIPFADTAFVKMRVISDYFKTL